MSIALLTQVYDETRRLSIAGSSAAVGDFRLKKLAPPLEQAGQKAPVFSKVAQAISNLVESNEKTAPEAILDLSTLLNAILYTQGETGAAGKLKPIETIDLGAAPTQATARVLKPLLEALSNTGSGRLEVIKDAHSRGVFRDLRLVKPALAALDDVYGEIADFISEQVLPLYGTAILPELRSKFDHKGKGGNVRRLTLMHALDPTGSRELVKRALDEGSKEVKVAAIECLGGSKEDQKFLLEQAKAKATEVREAALKALGKNDSDVAIQAVFAALQGEDIDLALGPIQDSKNPKLHKLVLGEAIKQYESLLGGKIGDKKELGAQVTRMLTLLECLIGREDEAADQFLTQAFQNRAKLAAIKSDPSGADIVNRLAANIAVGPPKAQATLVAAHATLSDEPLMEAFTAAYLSRDASEVFESFSPYFSAKGGAKRSKRTTIFNAMERVFRYGGQQQAEEVEERVESIDPRWLDLAVADGELEFVLTVARAGHVGMNQFLRQQVSEKLKKSKDYHVAGRILQTMVHTLHPDATEAMIELISVYAKSNQSSYYWIAPLIEHLPKDAAPKLEAILPGLPEKVVDQLLDHITELKNKPS